LQLTCLATLHERLNRLAQDLRSENTNLQGALERAAAERKSLEAAAALQAAHAQSGALVEVAAAHSERVVDEVVGLARGQQQLVALVCELREDLLGLVANKDEADVLVTTAASAASAELADALAAGSSSCASLGWLGCAADEQTAAAAAAAESAAEAKQVRSCSPAVAAVAEADGESGQEDQSIVNGSSSSSGVLCKPPLLRLKSVRGSVDAALAASIAETLQL
jgi:hypothetical protein